MNIKRSLFRQILAATMVLSVLFLMSTVVFAIDPAVENYNNGIKSQDLENYEEWAQLTQGEGRASTLKGVGYGSKYLQVVSRRGLQHSCNTQ